VWVSLDACSSVWDYDRDNYLTATSDELVEEMRERLSYLREVFGEERDARGRADTFIAQLIQANAALAVRVPELERRPDENQQGPLMDAQKSVRKSQRDAQSTPWWPRTFEG
jgi:hypothetical protein